MIPSEKSGHLGAYMYIFLQLNHLKRWEWSFGPLVSFNPFRTIEYAILLD